MKTSKLFFPLLIGILSCGIFYVAQFNGEMDVPSFVMHCFFRTFVNFEFPRKDLKDLQILRKLLESAAYPDIALHRYLTPDVRHFNRWINKDGDYPPVKVRLYNRPIDRKVRQSRNVIVWYHGGGFVLGGIETDHAICRQLADLTNSIVVSVEYRMAPEFPYPTPADDCYAALQWVHNNIEQFGGNPNRIIVAGESAGGNLAAVVTALNLAATTDKRASIVGSILIYPTTDIDGNHASHTLYAHTGFLTRAVTKRFSEMYCGHDDVSVCSKEWKYSPLKTPDDLLAEFPSTLVLMAKHDVLLDEGVAFHNRLTALHVDSELLIYNSTIHGFFGKHAFPYGPAALKTVASKINSIFETNSQQ